jgi:hypothetical protein
MRGVARKSRVRGSISSELLEHTGGLSLRGAIFGGFILRIWLYRRYPRILDAVTIVRPETVVRWHRMGYAAFRRWKSRPRGGKPRISKEVRDLIRRISMENPLWGAPRIHGELLKLGIGVAQSTVSIYMVPRQGRPLQTWKSFLRNHVEEIASIDLFVVPTITFRRLFVFLVLGHRRRQLLGFAVTQHPTSDWLARQITEAFPWDTAPKYLIRDNDRAFGGVFKTRVRAMGIRDQPTSFRSPWQNGYAERLIGSVRRNPKRIGSELPIRIGGHRSSATGGSCGFG